MEDVVKEVIITLYDRFEFVADEFNANNKEREVVKNLPNFIEWLKNN